jgi:hypothetical protein
MKVDVLPVRDGIALIDVPIMPKHQVRCFFESPLKGGPVVLSVGALMDPC